jgi:alkanesulfonate monooxygenase SsuD/methylene tetrahydromethanopterin reductase-like flavin-dependent oxidoreductase (luciferase family)
MARERSPLILRFGVQTGLQDCSIGELRAVWAELEGMGAGWINIWDHLYAPQVDPGRDNFEAISCHAALAMTTATARVGALVYCAAFRHPAVLAKAAVTIDHLSNGRLELGMGAGWNGREHRGYGMEFGSPGQRLRRLAEAVQVVRLLWTEGVAQFDGEFYTLVDAICHPKPVQPHPRIWIGAAGERSALPLVGRLADGWNVAYISPEDLARKLSVVREHASDPGRLMVAVNVGLVVTEGDAEDALRKRFGDVAHRYKDGTLYGSVDQIVDKVGRYAQAGADWLNIGMRAPFDLRGIERLMTEVVPQVVSASA